MIKTRKELIFFIEQDRKANRISDSYCRYLFALFCGSENARAFRYLKCLRNCEYHYNNNGLFHKLCYCFYRFYKGRLGSNYMIKIPLNIAGYGLRIPHLSGGYFIECQ